MPGIHVHMFSQLNWFDQEKESLLTVPGSYWLCHKKNIYKFIFRYHRLTKNVTQFSYGKELLKIIRRIIKCHPSQGQQFGTQHLLVTYNCTSWTRQDKIFAILKFQQRTNAAAFSHAFVLTIKICSSEDETRFDLKYPIVREVDADATFKDSSNIADIDEKATAIHTTDKVSTKKHKVYPGKRISQIINYSENALKETLKAPVNPTLQNDSLKKYSNLCEKPIGRTKSATCTVTEDNCIDKHNAELHDGICVNNSTNCHSGKSEKDMEQNPVAHRQDQSRTTRREDEIQEVEKASDANEGTKHTEIQRQRETSNIQKCQVFSLSKPFSVEIIKDRSVDERLLMDKSNCDEDSIRQEHATDDETNSVDNDIGEGIMNSSKVSNRYFIKKDLDNVKQNRASTRSATFSPVVDKSVQEISQQGISEANNANENFVSKEESEKINEEFTRKEQRNETIVNKSPDKRLAPISTRTVNDLAQSSTYSKSYRAHKQRNREIFERKTVADDKVLRSSNITDLVMEGLMFTIRQDQDSVAVIEQKTKLEVDEVLENSEKVETEAGEKCLLNSSLLRLENLITMIDPPREKDEQHKANHNMIGSSAYSSPPKVSNTTCHLNDINYVDRTTDKLNIPNYERLSLMDQPSPRGLSWQQQRIYSTIANNDNYSANRNATEKMDQSMDWEVDDSEGNEERVHQNDIEEMEDEEEDIVPEVFHSTIFSPEKTSLENTELLMDDMDVEEIEKLLDTSRKNNDSPTASCYSSSSNETSTSKNLTTSEKSISAKRETNIPRVISNKAITVEQIPLALQKFLLHKRRFSSAKVDSESSTAHDNKGKMQSTTSMENAASETNTSSDQSSPHRFRWKQQVQSDIVNSNHQSTDKNSMKKNEQSMKWEDNDHERNEECVKNISSERNRDVSSDTMNKFGVEIVDDVEEMNKSYLTIDLEDVLDNSNDDTRHTKENNSETHRTLQTTSSTEAQTRHGSPRKLQNITEDFYHDLYVHNKNIATQQRCLRQRRRSLNSPEDIKNGKMRIEMLKFIQDITEGVKVVVERLDLDKRPNLS